MEPYNFKKTFGNPITLYTLGKFSLPFGIGLARLIIASVTFGLMLLFRGFFLAIGGLIPGLTPVLFIGIPVLVSHFLLRRDPQGKKLHYYLYDLFVYFFSIYLPKKKYADDKELMYHTETEVTFEPLIRKITEKESDGDEHGEITNASEDTPQQLNVNKVG